MIKVEHLYKNFGDLEVLQDIVTEVKQGEVVAVIGPSGSGKSTLLRCMNLLESPSSGQVLMDDEDLMDPKTNILNVRQKLAWYFSTFIFSRI